MNTLSKINMFATSNDTDKWAVCVDDFFGLFETEAEAKKAYKAIGGYDGSDGLGDTPFRSAEFLPPQSLIKEEPWGGWESHTKISEKKPIDILNYIKKNWKKRVPLGETRWVPAHKRLKQAKEFKEFFGGEINLKEIARKF